MMADISFDYDLHLISLPGKNDRTMICFHGYGDNFEIALSLKNLNCIDATLVSFNFPDYDIKRGRKFDPRTASFGTLKELLPALHVLKKIVLDQGLDSIDLYGFSAGAGALINTIVLLNGTAYEKELRKIGIESKEKKKLLSAIQKGIIILDVPLKSIEEISDFRGRTEEFEILAKNYRDHDFRPIDSLKKLHGLSLNILLYFDNNDEILSNRDDELYIQRLKSTQSNDKIIVIQGDEGGHMGCHHSLWQTYLQKI